MNSQEFSFHLKSRRESLGVSKNRLSLFVNPHDFYVIENGLNVSLRSLCQYLELIKLSIWYQKSKGDYGLVELSTRAVSFHSHSSTQHVEKVNITELYELLSYMNTYGYKIKFGMTDRKEFYKSPDYKCHDVWRLINETHTSLRKSIDKSGVSMSALAESLKIKVQSLNFFLTGVVNHDFKLLAVIANRIGYIPVFQFESMSHRTLEIIDGKLIAKKYDEPDVVISNNCGKKVEDVFLALQKSDFKYVFFALDPNRRADPAIEEINVDANGKLKFDQYSKKDLEELIIWRSISILRNETCEYCHSRGIVVHLYPTKDKRNILLCQYCKDKVHPTNKFVHIIYTPMGGKNKR